MSLKFETIAAGAAGAHAGIYAVEGGSRYLIARDPLTARMFGTKMITFMTMGGGVSSIEIYDFSRASIKAIELDIDRFIVTSIMVNDTQPQWDTYCKYA